MQKRSSLCFTVASMAVMLSPAVALANGPCSDQIASVGRQLANKPGLGAPISEPSAGLTASGSPGAATHNAEVKPSDKTQAGGAGLTAGGSAGTVGGVAGAAGTDSGSREAVANGQVATSPEDVRRQSVGKPTTAQQAATGGNSSVDTSKDDKTSEAKMALQQAVDLNAKGDKSCMAAVDRARSLMSKG